MRSRLIFAQYTAARLPVGGLLSGKLAYVFLISIIDAAILSWLVLLWFRRSVRRLMAVDGGQRTSVAESVAPAVERGQRDPAVPTSPATNSALRFALYESDANLLDAPASPGRLARRRIVRAYSLGAATYALIFTAFDFLSTPETSIAISWLAQAWTRAWPIVPTLIVLLVLDVKGSLRVLAVYLAVGIVAVSGATAATQLARGTFTSAPVTNIYWLAIGLILTVYVPALLLVVTGWRRIRVVVPLVLASTLGFGFALIFFQGLMVRVFDSPVLRDTLLTISAFSSPYAVYYGTFMLLSLLVGAVLWKLLLWLNGRFERKKFSELQLLTDCWWLIVTAEGVTELSLKLGATAIAAGLFAFAAYRGVVQLMFRRSSSLGAAGPRLFLLRVFGYQARTESLFDRIAQRWRFHGPVQLIGGEDLATRTADPADLLGFVSGRLGEQYVTDVTMVEKRVAAIDGDRDPDGRFRVNELYCRADTWKFALVALLDASDCVLMDLRSFSAQNQGCRFELEQLLRRVPTDAVTLVVDRTTDVALLARVMTAAWQAALTEGRTRGEGIIALVTVEHNSSREIAVLSRRLWMVPTPHQVLDTAGIADGSRLSLPHRG